MKKYLMLTVVAAGLLATGTLTEAQAHPSKKNHKHNTGITITFGKDGVKFTANEKHKKHNKHKHFKNKKYKTRPFHGNHPHWAGGPRYANPYYNPYYRPAYFYPDRYNNKLCKLTNVQLSLKRRGYYNGKINGVLNKRTQRALVRFQSDYGLKITGRADRRVMRVLYG